MALRGRQQAVVSPASDEKLPERAAAAEAARDSGQSALDLERCHKAPDVDVAGLTQHLAEQAEARRDQNRLGWDALVPHFVAAVEKEG